MSNQEFTATRTMLANAFATAGAELLEYMAITDTAVAAMPDTKPEKYAIAGTLTGILQMAGKMMGEGADVERLLSSPAAGEEQTGDLTDAYERVREEFELAVKLGARFCIDSAMLNVDDFARAAIAAHLARQAQAEPVAALTPDGRVVTWDSIYSEPFWVNKGYRALYLAAPAGAHTTKHTDLAQRLRTIAAAVKPNDPALVTPKCLIDAADEIDRYYSGMLAWKQTAEKKDRDWNNEHMARVNERCEARAGAQNAEAIRNQVVPESIECWSRDEEDFNARSLDELLNCHDDLKLGDTVWVGEAVHPDPARLVNEDSIIENIGEAAYDIGGE
jgi:hypothetical protein